MVFRSIGKTFLVLLFLGMFSPGKASIDVHNPSRQAIGESISYLQEGDARLDLEEVLEAHSRGAFTGSQEAVLNFGIGSRPVWLALDVKNTQAKAVKRRLLIENAWLDQLDVFIHHQGRLAYEGRMGDIYPFSQRPIRHRFFALDHAFKPGLSRVFIRIESPDPMVIPVYLMDLEQAQDQELSQGYSYGVVYGVLLALLAYNVMIFLGLRSRRYLYYSIYLASFLILNLSYTGHAYQWLWPQFPAWQQWAQPLLMIVYGLCGFLFATRFLDTRKNLPGAHKVVKLIAGIFSVLLLMAFAFGSQVWALLTVFVFVFIFSTTMLLLGGVSLYRGQKSAKYFLIASISAMIGASITAASVWGFIPFNNWTYRAVEIGMLLDAVLLALALADQFRIGQEEKIEAERLSRADPLTGLNNRRAFYDSAYAMWSTALRNQRDVSMIMMDIDRFKQINDTYGHVFGDEILIQVAELLQEICREGDVLARWGGEEFLLYLPETSLDEAVTLAERLRERLSQLDVTIDDESIGLTASFGVAQRGRHVMNLDALISDADTCLYQAKAQGRNRVCSAI